MCHLYASTDTRRYDNITRSVRLQGCVTSVRLENEFWEILDALAASQQLSTARFISQLYSEVIAEKGEVSNLASLLRVVCAVHLQQRQAMMPAPLPRSVCL
ncbi:ribbon-helix-helix domain-containing protein [Salinicola corii]|uniref:Ribbon-helix-helix domain-containing protein n=1 Tax=Salinicola corii TaxID=2606937 RepID=A0A640WDU8_9GAMM|nr:ribbon-helix-helix domain-containing protein [Salinicola corii]KAA0018155.1 ribbon-helix-helix domain-containing protein [Salinicola corii]